MAKTVGTYYFGRYYRNWGIWVVVNVENGITMADKVKTVSSYADAVKETYRLNGWKQPERIIRKY